MTVIIASGGKIKVALKDSEVAHFGLRITKPRNTSPENRLILRALFFAISEKAGIYKKYENFITEVFKEKSGATVVFTPIIAQCKTPTFTVFNFTDGIALLSAVKTAFKSDYTGEKCRLYYVDGVFRIIVQSNTKLCLLLREYCKNASTQKSVINRTLEYGTAIGGEYIIKEIGERLTDF